MTDKSEKVDGWCAEVDGALQLDTFGERRVLCDVKAANMGRLQDVPYNLTAVRVLTFTQPTAAEARAEVIAAVREWISDQCDGEYDSLSSNDLRRQLDWLSERVK